MERNSRGASDPHTPTFTPLYCNDAIDTKNEQQAQQANSLYFLACGNAAVLLQTTYFHTFVLAKASIFLSVLLSPIYTNIESEPSQRNTTKQCLQKIAMQMTSHTPPFYYITNQISKSFISIVMDKRNFFYMRRNTEQRIGGGTDGTSKNVTKKKQLCHHGRWV